MTAIFAVTFVMSHVLICKWTLSHYDDDDDDDGVLFRGRPLQKSPRLRSPIAMSYGTYMGSIWELMWHTYGISCGLHLTTHMGATWANHMGSMWVPHGTHMWFTSVKPIWANHMYATWVICGSPIWRPYGWSGANHMKFHTFTILSSYVGTTWYTHVVYHCETHMGKPYVCHMSDIWLTHMTPIWVVGCKPHEIPYVCHMSSHMEPI